jgi:hypothetical protein
LLTQAEAGAGNQARALQAIREAVDICRASRGFSAPLTLELMQRLAGLLAKDSDRAALVEAEGLMQSVFAARTSTLGISHPATAHALSGLVSVLVALNKSEAALGLILKQARGEVGSKPRNV